VKPKFGSPKTLAKRLPNNPMKLKVTLLAAAALACASASSFAQVLLAVDFGPSWSATNSGFVKVSEATISTSVVDTTKTYTQAFDDITLTIATHSDSGVSGFHEPGGGGTDAGQYTHSAIYSSVFYVNAWDVSSPFVLTLSGLTPGAAYTLELFCYDTDHSGTTIFTPINGTGGSAGSVTYTANTTPTANDQYSTFLNVTADLTGNITIDITGATASYDSRRLNGLVLSSVPEPSAGFLLLTCGCLLTTARRRRNSAV
jgi:hypothetical protein